VVVKESDPDDYDILCGRKTIDRPKSSSYSLSPWSPRGSSDRGNLARGPSRREWLRKGLDATCN